MRLILLALCLISAGPALADPDFLQFPGTTLVWHSPPLTSKAGDGQQFYDCYSTIWRDGPGSYLFHPQECVQPAESVTLFGCNISAATAKAIAAGRPYTISQDYCPHVLK